MRIVYLMVIVFLFAFSLTACNDTSKVEELTKANAALALELKECKEAARKSSAQNVVDKEEKDSFDKYKKFKSNGPKF